MGFKRREETKKIVLHCSASPQGRGDTSEDIHRWHLERGWSAIGYHFVLLEDGMIEVGRPHWAQGAHVRGHNHDSIGVCFIGQPNEMTFQQYTAFNELKKILVEMYGIMDIVTHNDLDPKKECPGFSLKSGLAYNAWETSMSNSGLVDRLNLDV